MQIFRQYIAPLIVVIIFLIAMVAVSARIFLPGDLAAPAPTEEFSSSPEAAMLSIPNISDNQKSNQLFPPTPYTLHPTPYSLFSGDV
ncbi:MAG: hypothetical protein QNJ74_25015 [Trichodesmium sp. MO_231.B1]|nr:hypothetical protein [Trichodesmium sp. MO_231.B1]